MSRKSGKHQASRKDLNINRVRKIASAKVAPSSRPIMRKGRSIRPGTCANCGCPEKYTNLWRSGKDGKAMKRNDPSELRAMLCNACGLWLSEKGTPRPVHLASKWLATAREDAVAQYQLAIENGADPNCISIEDYMPRSQPVMPIAATRGPESSASSESSPHSDALPLSPSLPPLSSPTTSTPHYEVHNLSRPFIDYTVVDRDQSSSHDHEAASALMNLLFQAREASQPSSHASTSTRHEQAATSHSEPMPSCRLFDQQTYVPAWIGKACRSAIIVPPPAGFHAHRQSHNQHHLTPKPARQSPSLRSAPNARLALSVAQMCQQPAPNSTPRLVTQQSPGSVPIYIAPGTHDHNLIRRPSNSSSISGLSVNTNLSPLGRRKSSASSSYESVQSSLINTPVDSVFPNPGSPLHYMNKLLLDEGHSERRDYLV